MDKPIILISVGKQNGVAAWNEAQTVHTGCSLDYVEAVRESGGVPLLMPCIADIAALRAAAAVAHGVLLTGGGDIVSLNYGEEPHRTSKWADPTRDEMELNLAQIATEMQLPILGVGRGIQLLNVASGGTLVQDIPSEIPVSIQHSTAALEPIAAHTVDIEPDTLLASILNATRAQVNSYHHQAVKGVGRGLRVAARARDGVVEAIEAVDGRRLLAVQWHPEEMAATNEECRSIFTWLVNEARRYQEQSGFRSQQAISSGSVEESFTSGLSAAGETTHKIPITSSDATDETASIGYLQRMANAIISDAIRQSASEIHLEAHKEGVKVSYGIGETMHDTMTVPKHIRAELFDHYRDMAGLETADRSTPQDGVIPLQHEGKRYRIALKFEPGPTGESIFMRIEQ